MLARLAKSSDFYWGVLLFSLVVLAVIAVGCSITDLELRAHKWQVSPYKGELPALRETECNPSLTNSVR